MKMRLFLIFILTIVIVVQNAFGFSDNFLIVPAGMIAGLSLDAIFTKDQSDE